MWKTKGERDAAEVRRVLQGDRERFGVLVERYLPGVWAVASAHLGNSPDAEDAAQEAFVQAYVSLADLRDPKHFSAWLMTIARNTARGILRRRKREPFTEAAVPGAEPAAQPDVAAADTRRVVRAHVDRLDPDHREALLLHYFAGLSSREMGRTLGISPVAARKRLERARAALSVSMTRELHELRPDAARLRDRKDAIAKAVIATTVGWSAASASSAVATASAATAAAWSLLPSGKLLTGAALGIAATIGLGWYIAQQAAERPTQAQAEPVRGAQGVEPPAESEPIPELTQESSFVQPSEEFDESETPAATVTEVAGQNLSLDTGKENAEVESELLELIGVVFRDIHITKLMAYVKKVRDVPIFIDAKVVFVPQPNDYEAIWEHANGVGSGRNPVSYITDGMFASIDIRDQSLWEAMDIIVETLGLAYISEPGFIWISTPGRIAQEVVRLPGERFESYENEERFEQPIGLLFEDIHLQEVLEFVTDTFDVTIATDSRVIQPLKRPQSLLYGYVPEGFASDGVSQFVSLRQIQVRDALRAILRPLNLEYRVQWGAVVISTKGRFLSGSIERQDLIDVDQAHKSLEVFEKTTKKSQSSQGMVLGNPTYDENGGVRANKVVATIRPSELPRN